MKTFIFTETDSTERGCNKCITVHRIKRNRPHYIGTANCHTASWKGVHGEAVTLIHENDKIPYAIKSDGSVDRYQLRGELGPASKYDDGGQPRDAVRIFGV